LHYVIQNDGARDGTRDHVLLPLLTSFKLSAESSAESLPVIYPRPPTQKLRLGTP